MEEIVRFMAPSDVIANYSPLALAFLGDAAYELEIRNNIVRKGNARPKDLSNRAVFFAKAHTQAIIAEMLRPELTEDEADILRRGRNSSPNTMPKHATAADYHMATGFEAMIGFLYLSGQIERMRYLIDKACSAIDSEN